MKFKYKLCKQFLLCLGVLVIAIPAISQAHGWRHGGWGWHTREKAVVGYFIEWGIYGRNYLVKDVVDSGSAKKLTVINYAFANVAPNDNGDIVCQLADPWADYQKSWTAEQSVTGEAVGYPSPLRGNFQQLKALKTLYPNIKVMISLGGWTLSKYFSDAALTPESRRTLVKSCIDLFVKGNLPVAGWNSKMGGPGAAAGVFDGIDIDWEWPATGGAPGTVARPEDTENYTRLLREFRRQLNAVDPDLLLSVVAPANPRDYSKIQLRQVSRIVDFINMIGYDFHVATESFTNFQSNLFRPWVWNDWNLPASYNDFSVNRAVRGYLRAGVPRRKLNVGVPFYSRGWTGVNPAHHGLYQPAEGPAPGTYAPGIDDYEAVKALLHQGFQKHWDWATSSAWLFDGTTFWTFDGPATMCIKSKYVQVLHLRGIMAWDLSGDDPQGSLISAIDRCLQSNRGWGHWKGWGW